ncbi:DUF1963 domain-containing protein [Streptomyces roseoverticillatus]|uniref:YwqG family protein n=1 Tax=Streptomyces roseoverticillatus TaxID=66429 RepID=UPI001F39171F|nr:YwqG family protein [Streptomyces roseoverticillatus]MCF3107072.1 DUF1963 domain-containing protein [Streptomyces roseoverticillatus]
MTQIAPNEPGDESADELHDLAREFLPADMAERWISLLRPGLRLAKADEAEPVVGRLGGLPRLPEHREWPVWEGHGPLSFIASFDCAALPQILDLDFPADGTLSFFYFDGQVGDGAAVVWPDNPDTWAGACVVYVPAGVPTAERLTPEGLEPYGEVQLAARAETTVPHFWHPVVHEAFGTMDDDHPVWDDEFRETVSAYFYGPEHRVGGHASPVQDTVECEVAHAVLGADVSWDDPRINEEARNWTLLAQFDSDRGAGMRWGDCGVLYWLIRPEDLAAHRFDRAMLTLQYS